MMKNFIKQSDTTFVRIIKSLLIGGFIGAILGSVGALFIIFGQDISTYLKLILFNISYGLVVLL